MLHHIAIYMHPLCFSGNYSTKVFINTRHIISGGEKVPTKHTVNMVMRSGERLLESP